MLDLIVLGSRLFRPPSGPLAADEDGERTSDFSKPAALRGLDIAFGLTLTTPSGVRSTPGATGRGAPLSPETKGLGFAISCTSGQLSGGDLVIRKKPASRGNEKSAEAGVDAAFVG